MAFRLRRKNKEEQEHMSTLEQVRKAYEDLSDDDKKSFHQSIADRVHESIAAQEVDEGDKDSQSAEDREHEALGAEHADERKEEAREEAREEKFGERHDEAVDWRSAMDERLKRIEEMLTSKSDEKALEDSRKTYGLGNGVFDSAERKSETISAKEAADMARKLKG